MEIEMLVHRTCATLADANATCVQAVFLPVTVRRTRLKQGGNMRKRVILSLILLLAAGLTSVVSAVAAENGPVAVRAQTRPEPRQPEVNAITQAIVKAGILSCASRVNQVVNFLAAGVQNVNTMLFMTPNNPDQQLISISMEIPSKNAVSAYASASFAPNQANGCGAVYETVVYWPLECNALAERNFSALKRIGAFSNSIVTLDGGAYTKIFLMPAGAGCVSIKKEIIR